MSALLSHRPTTITAQWGRNDRDEARPRANFNTLPCYDAVKSRETAVAVGHVNSF